MDRSAVVRALENIVARPECLSELDNAAAAFKSFIGNAIYARFLGVQLVGEGARKWAQRLCDGWQPRDRTVRMNNDSSSWQISFGVSEVGCFSQAGAHEAEVWTPSPPLGRLTRPALILRNKDKDFDGQLRLSIAARGRSGWEKPRDVLWNLISSLISMGIHMSATQPMLLWANRVPPFVDLPRKRAR